MMGIIHTLTAVLALGSFTHALISRANSCCFGITASGTPGGQVGQLSDGQNRIGQGLPAAQYCISNGGITDGNGRGCILTPPTTQFQCDEGATSTGNFSIACDGTVSQNGSNEFHACPTGDNGGYNIYTTSPANQDGCVTITLTADSCHADCPAPPPPPPSPPQQTCPMELSGNYEFPHLIIPIDSSLPNAVSGTSYFGKVTSDVSSLFNFDIPPSDAGKTCSLVFMLPEQSMLETSAYWGEGGAIDFCMLADPAEPTTSYNNAPTCAREYGTTLVAPGNAYTITSFPCPAGNAVSFKLEADNDMTSLVYFQDYNPCPIGLYITVS